jgi:hypothetical protein
MPGLFIGGAITGRAAHDELTRLHQDPSVAFGRHRAVRRVVDFTIAVIIAEVAELGLPRVDLRVLVVAVRAEAAAATIAVPVLVLAPECHAWLGRSAAGGSRLRRRRMAAQEDYRAETDETCPEAE